MAKWHKDGHVWLSDEGGYSETDPNAPALDHKAYEGWVYGADFSQGMNEFRAPDGGRYIYNNSQHMGGPKLFSYDGRPVPPEVLAMVQAKVPDVQVGSDELMRRSLLDSDAPGNREGGSDLANIAGVLGFVGGGAALTGGSGLWSSLAEQFGVSDMLPTWMQPTAGGVADTGVGAGTAAGPGPWANLPAYPDYTSQIVNGTMDYGQLGADLGARGFDFAKVAPAMLSAGATAAQVQTVAQAASSGMGLKEAMSLAGVAAPVIGALMLSGAIGDASDAQQQATDAAIGQINASAGPAQDRITAAQLAGAEQQNAALATAKADLEPWRAAGATSINTLGGLVNDPNSSLMRKFTVADFMDDPVTKLSFQTGLDRGTQALQNSARSRGTLNSGSTLKALTEYGSDYGGLKAGESRGRFVEDQKNTFGKLMDVSNVGQRAVNDGNSMALGIAGNIAGSQNSAATNIANIEIGKGNSIANLLSNQGNARGAAAIAGGNAISGAANSVANWWNSQETLDKILAARKA
jgi:hypothetical protein